MDCKIAQVNDQRCLLISEGPNGLPRVDDDRFNQWNATHYTQCLELLTQGVIVLLHEDIRVPQPVPGDVNKAWLRPTR